MISHPRIPTSERNSQQMHHDIKYVT